MVGEREFKPTKAFRHEGIEWDITDEEWDCWMAWFLHGNQSFDPQIFNQWWFNKMKFEALDELEKHDQRAADLVKLRYFGGFSHQEAAESLGMSRGTADRLWAVARAWLKSQLE